MTDTAEGLQPGLAAVVHGISHYPFSSQLVHQRTPMPGRGYVVGLFGEMNRRCLQVGISHFGVPLRIVSPGT
jgi:hypothetical protein